jgi:16S rRNA (uracil1498-N3)-methyltransferase
MNTANHDRHLFFIYAEEPLSAHKTIQAGSIINLANKELTHRLTSILRLRNGEQVQLFSSTHVVTVTLQPSLRPKDTVVGIVDSVEHITPLTHNRIACIGLLKKESFEEAVHHATVTGATHIQPVITAKSRSGWLNEREPERLRGITIAASEQSKNRHIPLLLRPMTLEKVLTTNKTTQFIGFEAASSGSLTDLCTSVAQAAGGQSLALFIGPEGGFTTAEIEIMRHHETTFYRLTPTILRSQEAVCVALAIVNS